MEDDNLRELLDKLKITLIFILVVSTIFIVMISKKFGATESNVLKKLRKEDNFIILVEKTKCSNCKEIKKILNDKNINYTVLNVDREKYFETILKKLDITKNDIVEPTIIYVKEEKAYSILVDVKQEELKVFIENNLSNNSR